MNVVFVKRTLLKGRITSEAEKGMIENANNWLTMAKNEGFLDLKQENLSVSESLTYTMGSVGVLDTSNR